MSIKEYLIEKVEQLLNEKLSGEALSTVKTAALKKIQLEIKKGNSSKAAKHARFVDKIDKKLSK